jgi:hypothetical protein
MSWKRSSFLVLALLVLAAPAAALDIDRKLVKLRAVELPSVSVVDLDYAKLRVELAYGETVIGERVLKTTKSICVPEGSKNVFKDAVEVPTHYYEVPYRTGAGAFVLRDGHGEIVHTAKIEPLESYERFGYDNCEFYHKANLEAAYKKGFEKLVRSMKSGVQEYFERGVRRELDDTLFFNIVQEKVPVYRFKDKERDYRDLNEAGELAKQGYAALERTIAGLGTDGRQDLERAVEIWERALTESQLNDKKARINRKVTVKLHESVGVALVALGEPARAVEHLAKANRFSSMTTSRSSGTGTADLMARAQMRKSRARSNVELPETPGELEALMRESDRFRGKTPIRTLPHRELVRLQTEHVAFVGESILDALEAQREEQEAAVASGAENKYERMVGNTAMQGFYLFLMPYPEKLDAFPSEVCALTYLNRLRMPNHTFDSVPADIGMLTELEVLDLSGNRIRTLPPTIGDLKSLTKLDLSGNRIESLPDSIGRLERLKQLQLKGNPLVPGELERLKKLLPRCKIKA